MPDKEITIEEKTEVAATEPVEIKFEAEEYTISASAENTLNLGNYSSLKRGIYISEKVRVSSNLTLEKGTPDADRYKALREEAKKVQMLAETQLAGICMQAMGPEGFNDNSWLNVATRAFKNALARTRAVFGIKEEAPAPTKE